MVAHVGLQVVIGAGLTPGSFNLDNTGTVQRSVNIVLLVAVVNKVLIEALCDVSSVNASFDLLFGPAVSLTAELHDITALAFQLTQADIIADSIVDAILKKDPNGRVASEVFVAGKHIVIGGEVNAKVDFTHQDYRNIVKETLKKIGYNGNPYFTRAQCLHPEDIEVDVFLNQQSPDINQGVDQSSGEIGAGDQGIMFGFASSETENLMPAAITYARVLCDKVYDYALKNPDKLGVDIKTQVTIDYGTKSNFENCKPESIHTIVVSAPSVESLKIEEVRALIQGLIDDAGLPKELYNKDKTIIYINPTGRYVNHSSLHDSGLTGRKL